jgi:hypothetical protein
MKPEIKKGAREKGSFGGTALHQIMSSFYVGSESWDFND